MTPDDVPRNRLPRPGAREVVVTGDGPILVTGPIEIVLPDGRRVRSERPVTALCVCRRSRRAPFCDTSHRRKVRTTDDTGMVDSETEENRAQPHCTATE
jgi:CDGSH-type Zn-finger protein